MNKYTELRLEKALSIRQLAKELGIAHSVISRVEKQGHASLNVMKRYSEYFKVSLETLTENKAENDLYNRLYELTNSNDSTVKLLGNAAKEMCSDGVGLTILKISNEFVNDEIDEESFLRRMRVIKKMRDDGLSFQELQLILSDRERMENIIAKK